MELCAAWVPAKAADLTCDFPSGFLPQARPKLQLLVQGLGTFVAVVLAQTMFQLVTAYPCIIGAHTDTRAFAIPSISAWRATTIVITDPTFPVSPSSSNLASTLTR